MDKDVACRPEVSAADNKPSPAHIRKEMKITSGSRILINKQKDKLLLEIVPSFTTKLSGLTGKTLGDRPENVDQFIDGEREERLP